MDDIKIEKSWNYRIVVVPIMLFVSLFLVWSYFSEVDELVRGEGKVVPSSQTKILQHLEGGIVETIFVKEGTRVQKGDAIYKLKNASSQSDSKQKEIELAAFLIKKQRLLAQIEFKDAIDYDHNSSKNIDNEKKIFRSEMKNFFEQKSIFQDRLDQNRLEKKQQSSKLANLQVELKIASENLSILEKLFKKGAASKKQYLGELAKKQSLVTQVSDIKSEIPIIDQKINESLTKIKTYKSEKKSIWLKELTEVDVEIQKLQEKNRADDDREYRKIVTSPVNGVVKKLNFHTLGGIIKSGDQLAEITPIDDSLVIEGKIKTIDRGQVYSGQDVSIEITAYNYAKYGLLQGKLISISPDSFIGQDGVSSYYKVRVKADDYEFAKDKPILPGMVANVNILTGKKTVLEYIIKPLKDINRVALSEK
ncbi:MAG: HlyD family type I secretion periplasmic adaptor subunit [Epsilonproteobacteria bacterium]|nr:HlyD family type I secretion periplasmic adaptor subunit [Campylobacterota bacterium]